MRAFAGLAGPPRNHLRVQILVTGASGFVGSELAARLARDGHSLRALGRDGARLRGALELTMGGAAAEVELAVGDAVSGAGLREALEGVEVAYYLIHSMETRSRGARRASRSASCGRRRTSPARPPTAGVRRIVYLGGLVPRWERARTRRAGRGRGLPAPRQPRAGRAGAARRRSPDSVALRASIVIGARSRSFRLLVRLVERMPVLTLPAWQRYSTQPIDERDVIEMLAACARARAAAATRSRWAAPRFSPTARCSRGSPS